MQRQPITERLKGGRDQGEKKISLIRLIPNAVTVLALCCGLTSIRHGLDGRFEASVILLFIASLLDAMDGRIARLMKVESKIGAQLDSLVDFLNFGVAPVLLVYMWGMADMGRLGWLAMLAFTVCAALRLARFNVQAEDPDRPVWRDQFFTGMPSPAAGMLVLVPLILEFAGAPDMKTHYVLICIYTICLAAFMVSNIPTPSTKGLSFSFKRRQALFILLAFGLVAGTLLTFPWVGLLLIGAIYTVSMPFIAWRFHQLKSKNAI
ncbi:MAG: CDP-diacylglycerol--serine O-phosphatidyltransferase [Parvibaculales bacterium]